VRPGAVPAAQKAVPGQSAAVSLSNAHSPTRPTRPRVLISSLTVQARPEFRDGAGHPPLPSRALARPSKLPPAITTNDGPPGCPSGGRVHDASERANTGLLLTIVGPARPMQSGQTGTAASLSGLHQTADQPQGLANLRG
jgi:hypothetical protein